ncbi:hypothetical protein [Duncaniella muris]|uniref:hypothetical protein n=1 Tax=Duncaniella muris TaxID=2094150 RepID=UPI003F67ADE1
MYSRLQRSERSHCRTGIWSDSCRFVQWLFCSESFEIPESVQSIGANAFYASGLRSVSILSPCRALGQTRFMLRSALCEHSCSGNDYRQPGVCRLQSMTEFRSKIRLSRYLSDGYFWILSLSNQDTSANAESCI